MRRLAVYFVVTLALILSAARSIAHPMGNFSINHYARLEATHTGLELHYVLDMAEIPTVTEKAAFGAESNATDANEKQAAYLRAKCAELCRRLKIEINGRELELSPQNPTLELRPGAAHLDTLRLTFTISASWPRPEQPGDMIVTYQDDNYSERTGWKEIVVTGSNGATITASSASSRDISHELNTYPVDPGIAPPQQTGARFSVTIGPETDAPPAANDHAPAEPTTNRNTPQDAFTQSVAMATLTPVTVVVSLLLAFAFGVLHALSPGHGKAMVAAYLVGARGTVRHAFLLGAVVTLTHTVGVFLLGLITLIAARYVAPERLYPVISMLSGAGVLLLGLSLLVQRANALRRTRTFGDHLVDTGDYGDYGDEMDRLTDEVELQHSSLVGADCASADAATLSTKSLIVLGITGGALPCPSALVVLLSAIALHRVAFGMVLIVAFSLGLALVLTGIGILVVKSRGLLTGLTASARWLAVLPTVSAAAITLIGGYLLVTAAMAR